MKVENKDSFNSSYVGSVNTKHGELVIGFDRKTYKCIFKYKVKNYLNEESYVDLDAKEEEKFSNIFNKVDNEVLYDKLLHSLKFKNDQINFDVNGKGDEKTVHKPFEDSLKSLKILDSAHEDILLSTINLCMIKLLNVYPKCNMNNYNKRLKTLSYDIDYNKSDKQGESFFKVYDNQIYISENSFKSPSLLRRSVMHEILHLIGTDVNVDKNYHVLDKDYKLLFKFDIRTRARKFF